MFPSLGFMASDLIFASQIALLDMKRSLKDVHFTKKFFLNFTLWNVTTVMLAKKFSLTKTENAIFRPYAYETRLLKKKKDNMHWASWKILKNNA